LGHCAQDNYKRLKIKAMYNNRQFHVLLSDLSYEGKESVTIISERNFARLPKTTDGNFRKLFGTKLVLVQRISSKRAGEVQYERFSERYDQLIAEKYNMPLNWPQNRWFVEQVRPRL
jgi:hypothetical protein